MWQHDWMSKWALYSPNKVAVSQLEDGASLTYVELNRLAEKVAFSLVSQFRLVQGDRIAVVDEMSNFYVALMFACQKYGFVLVPVNYRLASAEMSGIFRDAEPTIILYGLRYRDLIEGDFDDLSFPMEDIQLEESFEIETKPIINEDDALFLIYTSGTTGKPKGVIYTHKMAFWNSINTSISLIINTQSITVNVMPPFHTGGWNVLLLPILHHGGTVHISKKFEASHTLRALEKHRCTIFMGVPTMLAFMAQDSHFEDTDLSQLDYIIVGGESMPVPLIERYDAKGVAIRQGYGMTEVGPNLTSLHQDDAIRKKGSIGRPNFYVNTRVIDEEGEEVGFNTPGELWLQGPMVTPGYWNNEEETKKAFSEDGQWFKTGDIVVREEGNYLYIVDRLKNMFISGAENVYPAEIEKVLSQLPKVRECAVIGVKDEKWGEVGMAIVVAEDASIDESSLMQQCQLHLAKFKIPKYYKFVDELPKTESGKIDRKKLKSFYS
jgi:fatty-acyl-CoA synthase